MSSGSPACPAADSTMATATSRTLRWELLEMWASRSKATCSLQLVSSMRMPLACSIAARLLIADKGYASAELDAYLHRRGVELLRPAYRNRATRPGQQLLAPIRQLIESVNDTLKGQLDLELHGGRTLAGVTARVAQRLLALTAAIWHNRATGQPVTRSLVAYDH